MMAAESTTINQTIQDNQFNKYKSWFNDTLKLPQYYDKFIESGYENLDFIDSDIIAFSIS